MIALVIRWLHVAAMATILGGAVLVTFLAWRGPRALVVVAATHYEHVFWAGIGVVVMTGVGNLGAFGAGLPAPASHWGGTFVIKMLSVMALVAISLPRSLVIARLAAGAPATTTLRDMYGLTSAAITAIAALAVWLAHG